MNRNKMSFIIAAVLVSITFMLGRCTAPQDDRPLFIDGDKVQINYTYNYDRLTVENCVTDWECKTAEVLHQYHAGELQPYPFLGLDIDPRTGNYIPVMPVAEPIPCDRDTLTQDDLDHQDNPNCL